MNRTVKSMFSMLNTDTHQQCETDSIYKRLCSSCVITCQKKLFIHHPLTDLFVSRQHSVDPDAPWWLVAAGPDRLLPANFRLRRRATSSNQHQHADNPCVQLRPGGQRYVVQRRGLQPARHPQQRSTHCHSGLYLRPAG